MEKLFAFAMPGWSVMGVPRFGSNIPEHHLFRRRKGAFGNEFFDELLLISLQ
jgi:hypothetical protein